MQRDQALPRIAFLLLLALSLVACGGSGNTGATATSTPGASTNQAGTGPKGLPLYCPLSVTVDRQDAIYVSDNDDSAVHERIIKLSPQGQALGEWHPFPPDRLGTTQGPGSMAIDGQGNMYVADLGHSKVLKLSPTGAIIASWGTYGSGPGQFTQLTAIALDSHGNVYVGDFDSNTGRIEKFTDTGKLLSIFTPVLRGQQNTFIPDGMAFDSSDTLYITDHFYMVKLSTTGQVLDSLKITDANAVTQKSWHGISVNAHGDLYAIQLITDSDKHYPQIMKIDFATGKVLAVLNVWKTGIELVDSIAVDSQGNVYATDKGKTGPTQLQKFSPTGALLATWQGTCSV